jgi:hypothetical protein
MKYAIKMALVGIIYSYIPSFVTIGSDIQVILMLMPKSF